MIDLFVGCSPNGEDAESMMILEYSLKKNTTVPYTIHWMKMSNNPKSPWYGGEGGWRTETWPTPFSGYRWAIPWVFQGERAVYCDSDFIFLGDLKNLWEQEFKPGKAVMAKGGKDAWRFCCAMWNIEEARKHVLPFDRLRSWPESHQSMMAFFANNERLVQQFQGNWNCIDGEDKELHLIDGLHYSDMSTQFHLERANDRLSKTGQKHWFDGSMRPHWRNDLKSLFELYYAEAVREGFSVEDYVPATEDRVQIIKASQAGYGSTYKGHRWSR